MRLGGGRPAARPPSSFASSYRPASPHTSLGLLLPPHARHLNFAASSHLISSLLRLACLLACFAANVTPSDDAARRHLYIHTRSSSRSPTCFYSLTPLPVRARAVPIHGGTNA
ncbi:hypothetical protein FKP32DRAFT_55409 [Trametes sanguinea]|nr:hypothetical protein FKP32DRAFT_55409 [Trametes sanguinea]